METQKIINLLDDSEESKFATKRWYVIDSQTAKGKYNQNNSIKSEAETIKLSLCHYFDAFIVVTGDITVNADNEQMLHLKILHYFLYVRHKIMLCLLMKQITFILQCLCTEVFGSLKDNNADFTIVNSESFKHKAAVVEKTTGVVNYTNSSGKTQK